MKSIPPVFLFMVFREFAVHANRVVFVWWIVSKADYSMLSFTMSLALGLSVVLIPVLAPLTRNLPLNRSVSLAALVLATAYGGYCLIAFFGSVGSIFFWLFFGIGVFGMSLIQPLSSAILASASTSSETTRNVRVSRGITSVFSMIGLLLGGVASLSSVSTGMLLAACSMLLASIVASKIKVDPVNKDTDADRLSDNPGSLSVAIRHGIRRWFKRLVPASGSSGPYPRNAGIWQ